MQSDAPTVEDYLNELSPERQDQLRRLLDEIRPVLPEGLSEEMGYGMITWVVPLDVEPDTYNGKPLSYAALASQKQYISLYLMTVYGGGRIDEAEFRSRWAGAKKLNMGKSCVRFTNVDDIDLDLIKEVLGSVSMDDFVSRVRESRAERGRG